MMSWLFKQRPFMMVIKHLYAQICFKFQVSSFKLLLGIIPITKTTFFITFPKQYLKEIKEI